MNQTTRPIIDACFVELAEQLIGDINRTEPHDTHVWELAVELEAAALSYTDEKGINWK